MIRIVLGCALAALVPLASALAQDDPKAALAKLKPKDFPNQPVEYTVVYPAGGGLDVTARLLAKFVEKWTGDRIIVNNRTGGAGMVGHTYLATQAKPDGYTVGVLASLVWGDAMLRAQGKWAISDLEPIGYLNTDALTWVGSTEGPYKGMSVRQVVQAAKDKPGTIRVATVPGSMWEYLLDQIEASSGAKFLRVPFQGGGAGITALIGGNVDVGQGFYSEFRGHMDAGKVAPLAVAAAGRMDFMKDVPTFNQAFGSNEYLWQLIRYAAVPKGTPADRKAYLGASVQTAMKDPELIAEYTKQGVFFDPRLVASKDLVEDFKLYIDAERQFYQKSGKLK